MNSERQIKTSNGTPALELRHGTVMFGTRMGLRDISLSLASGERMALLGPSGSGKTSLLRALAGLDEFSTGTLHIGGVDVTRVQPEHRGAVYLHQTPALFPHLSVLDNVAFPLLLRGTGRKAARERARALLERVRLGAVHARMPEKLSGGEKHRTALARALAAEPSVLLLDEPFSALDPSLRKEVQVEVLEILSLPNGPAVLIVTHNIGEAALFGQQVAVLLNGTIVQCDAVDDVLQRPETLDVARFLGMPNVVHGVVTPSGQFQSVLGELTPPAGTFAAALNASAVTAAAVGWVDMIAIHPMETPGASAVVVGIQHGAAGRTVRVQTENGIFTGLGAPDALWQVGDRVTVAFRTRRPHIIVTD